MKKKEFIKPTMQVIKIAPAVILAGSTRIDISKDDATEDACSRRNMFDYDNMDEE